MKLEVLVDSLLGYFRKHLLQYQCDLWVWPYFLNLLDWCKSFWKAITNLCKVWYVVELFKEKQILQCASWRSQLFSSWLQTCSCLIACRKKVEFHPKVFFFFSFGWWPNQNGSLQIKKRKKGEKNWTWETPHLINTKMNNPKNIR
jgi:hypothetical protein